MKKGDGYYLDEFGHTHSEDYLAVTVRYVAEGQLRTLLTGADRLSVPLKRPSASEICGSLVEK